MGLSFHENDALYQSFIAHLAATLPKRIEKPKLCSFVLYMKNIKEYLSFHILVFTILLSHIAKHEFYLLTAYLICGIILLNKILEKYIQMIYVITFICNFNLLLYKKDSVPPTPTPSHFFLFSCRNL